MSDESLAGVWASFFASDQQDNPIRELFGMTDPDALQSWVSSLSAELSDVFVLCCIEKRTEGEVATLLGATRRTVTRKLKMIRLSLLEFLDASRTESVMVSLTFPDHFTDEQIVEEVKKLAAKMDAEHRALGGNGIVADSMEITSDVMSEVLS